jgi:ABC-type multidrug transport system ATPase subunit/ABC-type multidrug transport system permease subunit
MVESIPIQVEYKNVSIIIPNAAPKPRSVKKPAVSLITNFAGMATAIGGLCAKKEETNNKGLYALKNCSGVLKPGSSTIVLGSPGSGKSMLLRMCSGRERLADGSVTYNGQTKEQLAENEIMVTRLACYAPQTDIHEPLLTVEETMSFVHSLSYPKPNRKTATNEEIEEYDSRVENMLKLLGIAHVKNTVIGSEQVRGISGGQKRRVTLGETLLRGSLVWTLDEVTNGLDAATSCQVLGNLIDLAKEKKSVLLTALQAPTPETFTLFDDVILMGDGRIMYHGPVDQFSAYLETIGYQQPETEDLAVWAVKISTSPSVAADYLREHAEGKSIVPVFSTKISELAEYWDTKGKTWLEARLKPSTSTEIVDVPNGVSFKTDEAKRHFGTKPTMSTNALFNIVLKRQFTLFIRNKLAIIVRIIQAIFIGLVVGSLFYQVPTDKVTPKISLLSFVGSFLAFSRSSDVPVVFLSRLIQARHLESKLFPAWINAVVSMLIPLPLSVVFVFILGTILYWMVGYVNIIARWWFFLLVMFSTDYFFASFFRVVTIGSPTLELASVIASIANGVLTLFAGFIITVGNIPDYGYLAYYVSPFAWMLRSFVINEFTAPVYTTTYLPNYPNITLSQGVFIYYGFQNSLLWMWGGVIYLIGMSLLMSICGVALASSNLKVSNAVGSKRAAAFAIEKAAPAIPIEKLNVATPPPAISAPQPSNFVQANPMHNATPGGHVETPFVSVKAVPAHETLKVNHLPTPHAQEEFVSSFPTEKLKHPVFHPKTMDAYYRSQQPVASFTFREIDERDRAAFFQYSQIALTFKNICYSVPDPKAKGKKNAPPLQLLRNVTGFAKPGTMTALMGASGAGKTTLLDVISGRKTTGTITGDILLNGKKSTKKEFANVTGYCEQIDLHLPCQTVYEAIMFSSKLRAGKSNDHIICHLSVMVLMDLLELLPLRNSMVSALSPAETKKLTIAVELASNPSVVFLDEPTSGLDARSAAQVVNAIRRVANTGRTIICTIHQPSSSVFFAFDHLFLLAPGGWMMYTGKTGPQATEMVQYLESIPGVPKLPFGVNPANWMLDILAIVKEFPENTEKDEHLKALKDGGAPPLSVYYYSSERCIENSKELDACHEKYKDFEFPPSMSAPLYIQLVYVFSRSWNELVRSPIILMLRLIMTLFLALLFGLIWYKIPFTTASGIQSIVGFLAAGGLFEGAILYSAAFPGYFLQRAVFYREQAAKAYVPEMFSLALALADLPLLGIYALLFSSICYFMVGLVPLGPQFATFFLGVWGLAYYLTSIFSMLTALAPSMQVAQIIGGVAMAIEQLFSGLFIPVNQMNGWSFLYYISGTSYGLRLMGLLQFSCGAQSCPQINTPTGPVDLSVATQSLFGVDSSQTWNSLGWLVLVSAVLRVISFLGFRFINWTKR